MTEQINVPQAVTMDDVSLTPAAMRVMQAELALGATLATLAQPSILAARLDTRLEDRRQRRREYEQEWVECYQRYNSIYPADIMARIHPKKSKLWVGMTALKVNSAHSAIMDFLRSGGEDTLPWSIDPMKIPENTILPEGLDINGVRDVIQGRVDAMAVEVENQFDDCDFEEELDMAVLELCITGSMGMVGPLTIPDDKEYWEMDLFNGNRMQEVPAAQKFKPTTKFVSIFNLYLDMEAPNV